MSQEEGDPQALAAIAEAKENEDGSAADGAAKQDGSNAAGSTDPIPPPPPATPIMDPESAQRFLNSMATIMQQQQQMTAVCVQ